MIVKVEVTEKDIQWGERLSGLKCPVSLGIQRALKEIKYPFRRIHAGYTCFNILTDSIDHLVEYKNNHVSDFISNFDMGNKVDPISFEIEV